ncbi:hypothetical protein Dsin_033015 [Dipteronia sinensis]|uniref:Zinc finger Mcm10/DnaG-type domain-containing protein n=1 Tax=Dipteronia sinensis TaxID=43782 RepID=A0AAD9ZC15_9ROSI|nr:hypothetical protein Dsin_033015 [Dipteronia sinensis]
MSAPNIEDLWPPQSARQALLSSPSGRKKYTDLQSTQASSPIKRSLGTPSLLDRLRLTRNNQNHVIQYNEDEDVDEGEEDEETLRLKLAAIEAKLKLKKLQNKSKKNANSVVSRPDSVCQGHVVKDEEYKPQVEVCLSPVKRSQTSIENLSPSRVLLGIDKGVRGANVSLRRAKTISNSPVRSIRQEHNTNRPIPRGMDTKPSRKARAMPAVGIKSFSERMAEVRDYDRKQADRSEVASRARARKFKLDAAEIEQFKASGEGQKSPVRCQSPNRVTPSFEDRKPEIDISSRSHGLRKARTLPDLRTVAEEPLGDATLFEGYSGLHLSSRILPHSFLKRTLPSEQFTTYRIPDLLKNITSPAYELPDEVSDFVVFGVIASKSNPLDQKLRTDDKVKTSSEWDKKWDDGSQNRKKFMVLTLTDLKWTVDLFLFDTALPRYHRLSTGTVIGILNPTIMPPKRGREDTGAFSLALHDGDDTVLEIGKAKHLGYCNAVKKDGKECGQWVNGAKSEICEWHLNAQIAKAQSRRMGVNTGANGFGGSGPRNKGNVFDPRSRGEGGGGGYGLLPNKQGRGFDRETGSHYYVSSSNSNTKGGPIYNPDISTAKMIDLDDDSFIAEGQFSRDKEALLQKRMAKQGKEQDIARKLAKLVDGHNAGADYMRHRTDNPGGQRSDKAGARYIPSSAATRSTSSYITNTSDNLKTEIGRKRMAQDISLSPIKKKTRFLTDRGIKEAGRESLGPNTSRPKHDFDEDDDDLDIV